jgi:quinolinate synthase
MLYQPPLEAKYNEMPEGEVLDRIAGRKAEMGGRVCILGHHYQRDEVFRFADLTGDSLKLSRLAAESDAEFIIFCGVHFMAESAEVLTGPGQAVLLPDMSAGCAMAEMADADDVAEALERVRDAAGGSTPSSPHGGAKVVPITYVNSSAAVKAATGRAGGACCTSSNVRRVFEWAFRPAKEGGAGADKVFAIPDEHLARNTAVAMGAEESDCVVYDPRTGGADLADERIAAARFILWRGHCYVHQRFTVEQVEQVRAACPGIRVIVHPECPRPVVAAADEAGSTEQILRTVADAPAGSNWAIGTEANMVRRLAAANPDKFVRILSDTPPMCITMARIDPPHLLRVLDELAAGRIVNRVTVPEHAAEGARLALERMVSI